MYDKFISSVQSKKFLKEKEKHTPILDNCNSKYDGDVKELGDQIRVRGLGKVNVWHFDKNGVYTASQVAKGHMAGTGKDIIQNRIPDFEEPNAYEVAFTVNQIAQWGAQIGDIDKELADDGEGIWGTLRTKYAKQVAQDQELYAARTMALCPESQNEDYKNGVKVVATETTNEGEVYVLDLIDDLRTKLNEREYSDSEEVFCECTPKFWQVLKKALRNIDTDNSTMVRGRKVTEYNGVYFWKTNNVKFLLKPTDKTPTEFLFFRTKNAVTFADCLTKVEAVRPSHSFKDAVKGFSYYDCLVTEPNALIVTKILGY